MYKDFLFFYHKKWTSDFKYFKLIMSYLFVGKDLLIPVCLENF